MAAARGVVIAAPASGSGKTTVTLGLLRHLARSGSAVSSFKTGPDYIDPAFHEAAGGHPCLNLDSWAMRPEILAALYQETARGADIVIGEGVMGLFDGGSGGSGSTAELAASLGLPVILVVDASAQGQSAAATVHGFATWRKDVRVDGIIFNRVGSDRHAALLRASAAPLGIPVIGCLPRTAGIAVPERHLGLMQASELAGLEEILDSVANVVSAHLDLDAFDRVLAEAPWAGRGPASPPVVPLGQHIAIARDDAFRFHYRHVVDGWHRAGAGITFFSPLADEAPDGAADAVYLPGGYPELHAGTLAGNRVFVDGLAAAAERGAVLYGECGGYMVLGRSLTDAGGVVHRMAGLLPLDTSFAEQRLHLGYRRASLVAAGPLGPEGARFRAHEFHYATICRADGDDALFALSDIAGAATIASGQRCGRVMGSFIHLIDSE